jgi:regulator of ribonuclease activity A
MPARDRSGYTDTFIDQEAPDVGISTPDLSDNSQGSVAAIELQFTGFGQHSAFGGQIVTVKCYEDNSLVKQILTEAGAGKVLVVDGGGSMRRALLGDMIAASAVKNGWAGVVINGCIRDVDEVNSMALGVKALGSIPLKTEKRGEGQRDIIISFGSVQISPGDYLYADNNGIIVSGTALL